MNKRVVGDVPAVLESLLVSVPHEENCHLVALPVLTDIQCAVRKKTLPIS